jgi:hypothetical protein
MSCVSLRRWSYKAGRKSFAMEKCCDKFALHPLHDDEVATLGVMQGTRIRMMPTHCINLDNQLEGFQQTVESSVSGSSLCIHRSMFFGHSIFECVASEELINADVVKLLAQDNALNLGSLMRDIDAAASGHEASFDCAPDNSDAVAGTHGSNVRISYARGKRAVDSRRWMPEVPQVVGLYHAMVRGYQKDTRQHKLFIGVSGGCSKCSDSFYNLMIDVGDEWTARDVANSEEVWWLRKACQRSRCRVASLVAKRFGLTIREQIDVHSYDQELIGIPTTDTVEHDIVMHGDSVSLYNACCDTSSLHNGILCQMNPAEGFWLFKGNPRSSTRATSFGTMFAHNCEVFPTHSPTYHRSLGNPSCVQGLDSRLVVRNKSRRREKGEKTVYQCFDEAFMRKLEDMGWNRDHGVVELVPIVVGCP